MNLKHTILAAVAATATIAPALAHAETLAKPIAVAARVPGKQVRVELYDHEIKSLAMDPTWTRDTAAKCVKTLGTPLVAIGYTKSGKRVLGCWGSAGGGTTVIWNDGTEDRLATGFFEVTQWGRNSDLIDGYMKR
ncbi:hypothetical protein [Cupriavidus necator]